MATSAYINANGTFNLRAIMSAAWASARQAIQPPRPMRGYTPRPRPTLRAAFKAALRRIWDLARGHKASQEHFAAAVAADKSMSPMECRTIALREARVSALMIDSTRRMVAELSAIDARAAELGVSL